MYRTLRYTVHHPLLRMLTLPFLMLLMTQTVDIIADFYYYVIYMLSRGVRVSKMLRQELNRVTWSTHKND